MGEGGTVGIPSAMSLQSTQGKAVIVRHAGEKVVLATHSLVIRVLLCHALGAGLSTVAHLQCRPGSITVIDGQGDR